MTAKKTAAKKAPSKRVRVRKPAARRAVASKLVVGQVAEIKPIVTKLKIEVDATDLNIVGESARQLQSAVDAVGKLISVPDPGQKRLHRRVRITIYDGEGTRLSNAEHDVKAEEVLTLTVHGDLANVETTGPRA